MLGNVKRFTLAVGILIASYGYSQEILAIGTKDIVASKILQEDREVWVHLPKSYHDASIQPAKYPVVYLLDAETNFDYYSGMADLLAKSPYAEIPELIVVGITNTDRTRDLTPTKSLETKPNSEDLVYPTSGGGELFSKFITEEIQPYINKKYRTTGYTILVGHSYGGLFVTQELASPTNSYDAYIIHDPSLWWNNQSTMSSISNYFQKNTIQKGKQIYLSQANNAGRSKKIIEEMTSGITSFKKVMEAQKSNQFQHKFYENEGHGTVIFPANFDALRFVFKGFATNLKDYAEKPDLLMKEYEAFSEKQNFKFLPSETYLNFIIKYMERIENSSAKNYFINLKSQLYKSL